MNYGATLTGTYYPLMLGIFLRDGLSIDEGYHEEQESRIREPGLEEPAIEPVDPGPKPSELVEAWSSIAGFPLGMVAGYHLPLPGVDNHDYGRIEAMAYFSKAGAALGWALPALFEWGDSDAYRATGSGLSMGMVPAGFYAGYLIVKDRPMTSGRGVLLYVTGVMSTVHGLLIPTLFEEYDSRAFAAGGIAGGTLGSVFALKYHKNVDYSFWQGVFMGVSSVGGTLTGLSVPLIFQTDQHQYYTLMAIAGGWGGFFLGEKLAMELFERAPQDKDVAIDRIRLDLPIATTWPMLMLSKKSDNRSLRETPVPLASVRVGF
jgi:hypothetical protein